MALTPPSPDGLMPLSGALGAPSQDAAPPPDNSLIHAASHILSDPQMQSLPLTKMAANVGPFLPTPPEIKILLPEWQSLATKMNSGNISDPEILRLDSLNQQIMGHLRKIAN
jgi:hypothetical protein